MNVEVVVPWRDGCEHRRRALAWVAARWRSSFPDWRLTLAELPSGPWVKALAVMPAVEASPAAVVIVADADVWCASDAVVNAVTTVEDGAPWTIPHGKVRRLTVEATARVYAGADPATLELDALAEPPYWGVASGGLVVMARDVALDVPLDDRFAGWGGEDHSWGYALGALHGPPERGTAPLWHLWHPPAPRVNRKIGSHSSEMLRRRYRDARQQAEMMRQLVAEVPRSWQQATYGSGTKASGSY